MGTNQSRQRDPANDRTILSSDDSFNDERTLSELCDGLIDDLKSAVQEGTGWSWKDTEMADGIYDALTDLTHWKNSILLLAAGTFSAGDEKGLSTPTAADFFESVETNDESLAETIRSYLNKAIRTLSALQAMHHDDAPTSE